MTIYRAHVGDIVVAESNDVFELEGYQYFPRKDVREELLRKTDHRTNCPWKGQAHYYNVITPERTVENGAWYYPVPTPAAKEIIDRIAFWKDVTVSEVPA